MVDRKTKQSSHSVAKKETQGVECSTPQDVIEDLFFDFYKSRRRVYWVNFWRGLFFGIGSVVGITVFVVFSVWILSKTADIFPAMADFINTLIDTMQRRR